MSGKCGHKTTITLHILVINTPYRIRTNSVANLVMSGDEHIVIEFDKSQYWITIKRIYRNESGRKYTRKRQVNWIACHSVVGDDVIKVNVEKLFR